MRFHHYLTQLFNVRRPNTRSLPWKRKPSRRLCLEALEDRTVPAVFMVTSVVDSGPGSLRQAMLDAEGTVNQGGVPDEIHFNIPGNGVHTIFPGPGVQSPLPTITDAVIIDGYTQPGASPNTLAVGDNAVLTIEINGSNMSPGAQLFIINGSNGSTMRGLAITHVPYRCFSLGYFGQQANNNIIAGNFIGTDAGGLTYQAGDTMAAIGITTGSNNVIGGPAPADRNVITSSGSGLTAMIDIGQGTGNVIQGNYIGVNKNGDAPLQPPNGINAISINGQFSGGNTIGGLAPGEGNVILGTNTGIVVGIFFAGTTDGNVIQGNFIGTNATGTAGLGGGLGLDVQSSSDTITGNLISGNSIGILIDHQGPPGPGPTIQGNKIGTDVSGTAAIPNTDGIRVFNAANATASATIGGTHPGDGNTIAFNSRYGVLAFTGKGNSILGNSIFANGSLGISLTANSDIPRPNDPGDTDTGANGWQNYPVLTSVATNNGTTTVIGTLNSTPNTTFRIEFFANDVADSTGFGEGQTWMEAINVTTDAIGDASFSVNLDVTVGVGQFVSATATDPGGNTSEFTADVVVTGSNNTPIITSLDGPTSGLTEEQLSYTGEFIDPDADTWTGTVNFGDGSGDQPLPLNPDQTFAFDHVFSSPGTFTVTVTVADNHASSDSGSLIVTVTTNTPPVISAFNGEATGLVGQQVDYVADFHDPDADTWTGTVNWGDGTSDQLAVHSDVLQLYGHTYQSPGTYSVSLTVADNHGNSDTRSRTTTITDGHPPVISAFNGEATGLVGQQVDYVADFHDPDADTWTGTVNWGDGTSDQLAVHSDVLQLYGHTYQSPGTYSVSLTVADNHGNSDTRSVTTTITAAQNRPPHAVADAVALINGTTRTINVLANDSDPDGNPLTVTGVTQPASGHGIVTINANGTLNYKQKVYANGAESFTYTISDGHGGTATATVRVTVNLPASVGIEMLIGQVPSAGLPHGLQNSLREKLHRAQQALASGHVGAAAGQLAVFALEVRLFRQVHILTTQLANLWLFEEENILAALGL